MTLEIQVLAWDRHKKCGGVKPANVISQFSPFGDGISILLFW
jgi:hypothetical protein